MPKRRTICGFCLGFCLISLSLSFCYRQTSDRQQEAIKHLESIGAVLTTDDDGKVIALQFPEGYGFNEQGWRHIEQLTDLRDLDLGAVYVGNDMLKHVGKLTELRNLNLFGNPIDSIALTHIENLQNLETLYLYRTFVDDKCLESVAKLKNLQRLNMFDTFLTDKGLVEIGKCKQLRHLGIGNSKAGKFPESFFSEAGIDRLKKELPDTEITYWGSGDRLDFPQTINLPARKASIKADFQPIATATAAPDLSQHESGSDGSDWPRFLGPTGTGKSTESGIIANWSQQPPRLLWHKKIGTGYAAPTIAKGRLLLYHRVPDQTGKARFLERLSSFHSETGEAIWQVDFPTDYSDLNGYGDGPRSTPLVDGDRVFLVSPSGVLRCLQLVDGKTLWEVDLVHSFDCLLPTYGMGASPIVHGDKLLVVVGGRKEKQNSHTVVALDKTNGVFRYGVGDHPASYATPVISQEAGRSWCFTFSQDGLLCFNPNGGKVDFEYPWQANIAGSVNAASPVVHDGQVFISESYRLGGALLRFTIGEPSAVWRDSRRVRTKSMACHWNTPILHEGFLYGCSGRHRSDGKLKCIEWSTGQARWEMKLDGRSSLTYVDGHFLNQSESGLLTLFKATPTGYVEAGRLDGDNAKVVPSYPAWTAPVVAKGLMYLRGKQELICYDLRKDVE